MLGRLMKYKKPICVGLGLFVAGELALLGPELGSSNMASASVITSQDSSETVELEDLTDTADSGLFSGFDLGAVLSSDAVDTTIEETNLLEEKLADYTYDSKNQNEVNTYLMLKSVVENNEVIQDYSDVTGLPFSLIAAQLYSESTFNPYLRSDADAYGLGQLKEIAMLESVYTLMQVPGGFNKKGETKVSTLLSKKLEKKHYGKKHNQVFGDGSNGGNEISQLDVNELIKKLDQIIGSEEFSFVEYQQNTQERVQLYDQLSTEYNEKHKNPKFKDLIRKNISTRKSLCEAQEKDNGLLRSTLVNYWHENVGKHQGKERFVQRKGKTVRLPGYEINQEDLSESYVSDLNFFTMLNMVREYGLAGDDFSIGSGDLKSALRKYGDGNKYARDVMKRYEVIDEFVNGE